MQDPFLAKVHSGLGRWYVGTGVLWMLYGAVQIIVPFLPGMGKGWGDPVLAAAAAVGGVLAFCGLFACFRAAWAAFVGTVLAAAIVFAVFGLTLAEADRLGADGYGLIVIRMVLPVIVWSTGIVLCLKWSDYRKMLHRPFVAAALADGQEEPGGGVRFGCPHCAAVLFAEHLATEDLVACPVCVKGFSGGAALGGPDAQRPAAGVGVVCEQTTRTDMTQGPSATQVRTEAVLRRVWAPPAPGPGNAGACPYCGHELELGVASGAGRPRGPRPTAAADDSLDVVRDTPPRPVKFPALIVADRGWNSKKVIFRIVHKVAAAGEADAAPAAGRDIPLPARRLPPRREGAGDATPAADGFVRFECPRCGKSVKAAAAQAGKHVKCPRQTCGCVLKVPGGAG